MIPIPFADSPRKPDPRPDGDARAQDDRPDAGPEAFLAAMGLIPGAAAPDAAGREAGAGTSAGRTGAAAPAPVPPAGTAQPAGTGEAAGTDSGAAGTEDHAPATPASPQEIAFLAAHRTADPAAGGGDGGERGDPAPAADPAPPADSAASGGDGQNGGGRGGDGQGADGNGPPASLHPARQRGAGTLASSAGAAPAGGDAGPAPKAAAAEPAEAGAPAAPPAAKPGGRTGATSAGREPAVAVDALSFTPDATAEAAAGPDPAGSARGVDRPQAAAANPAPLPAGFGHRLAEAVAHFPDRAVELTLSPEELGRVRMTLSTQDGVLSLSIQADRPETIDLMRRHIDQLAQDFRDLGFTDLSFSFGRDDTARSETPDRHTDADMGRPAADTVGKPPPGDLPPGAGGHGLDLRL